MQADTGTMWQLQLLCWTLNCSQLLIGAGSQRLEIDGFLISRWLIVIVFNYFPSHFHLVIVKVLLIYLFALFCTLSSFLFGLFIVNWSYLLLTTCFLSIQNNVQTTFTTQWAHDGRGSHALVNGIQQTFTMTRNGQRQLGGLGTVVLGRIIARCEGQPAWVHYLPGNRYHEATNFAPKGPRLFLNLPVAGSDVDWADGRIALLNCFYFMKQGQPTQQRNTPQNIFHWPFLFLVFQVNFTAIHRQLWICWWTPLEASPLSSAGSPKRTLRSYCSSHKGSK
jgi:hypothetical protein